MLHDYERGDIQVSQKEKGENPEVLQEYVQYTHISNAFTTYQNEASSK